MIQLFHFLALCIYYNCKFINFPLCKFTKCWMERRCYNTLEENACLSREFRASTLSQRHFANFVTGKSQHRYEFRRWSVVKLFSKDAHINRENFFLFSLTLRERIFQADIAATPFTVKTLVRLQITVSHVSYIGS